jgi:hypothetical protein
MERYPIIQLCPLDLATMHMVRPVATNGAVGRLILAQLEQYPDLIAAVQSAA